MTGNQLINSQQTSRRGGWLIIVGLSLVVLSVVLFLIIFAAAGLRETRSKDLEAGAGPESPPATRSLPTETPPPIALPPASSVPAPSVTTVAPVINVPPITVTVRLPSGTSALVPQGGALTGTVPIIAAITALVVAIGGLITAGTGLLRELRSRGPGTSAPSQ